MVAFNVILHHGDDTEGDKDADGNNDDNVYDGNDNNDNNDGHDSEDYDDKDTNDEEMKMIMGLKTTIKIIKMMGVPLMMIISVMMSKKKKR